MNESFGSAIDNAAYREYSHPLQIQKLMEVQLNILYSEDCHHTRIDTEKREVLSIAHMESPLRDEHLLGFYFPHCV